jgi:hypothetical protein
MQDGEIWGNKVAKLRNHTSSNMAYCELTHRPNAPSAIPGPLDSVFYPVDKANVIADCLEN